jgi:hypothetical protein
MKMKGKLKIFALKFLTDSFFQLKISKILKKCGVEVEGREEKLAVKIEKV